MVDEPGWYEELFEESREPCDIKYEVQHGLVAVAIMTTGVPWVRLLSEGVVVIASILIAFAIDTWWDGRQNLAF